MSKLLNVIYGVNFYDFSHAFRKGHSQHKALHELREKLLGIPEQYKGNPDNIPDTLEFQLEVLEKI